MLSAVKRYTALISGTLVRCFPRTTAYLRAEREAAEAAQALARAQAQQKKARPRGRNKKAAEGKGRSTARKSAPKEPGGARAAIEGPSVYRAAALPRRKGAEEAMRARVAEAVAAGVVAAPSDEQWAMILARGPLTRIFAGAGSGKSTTLLLRVVYLLAHLGVDPAKLTVISFTNASCAQLREQLTRVLAFWQVPFDAAQARQCVRTFHSAMGVLAKSEMGVSAWFEQLDSRDAGDEPDNPLAAGRLKPAQQRLLQETYHACYAEDVGFRMAVHALLGLEPDAVLSKTPEGPLRLAGELGPMALPEAFHVQAGFIESLGLRVEALQPDALACPPRDQQFIRALQPFWARFQALLRQRGLATFNMAFGELTERLEKGGLKLPALVPLTHLLIDEFQDISPQIVRWLRAAHERLAQAGETPSLMAIGDDWQSIYGWRGSSPELFMDFDRHFAKGRGKKSAVLRLETNYRSIDAVVRDGEAVLGGVAFKQDKTCRAVREARPGDHGVRLVQGFELPGGLPALVAELQAQCAHVAGLERAERTPVLLLGRRNDTLRTVQTALEPGLPVKALTIHRAKGLQAEVAVIVDDCQPPESHPLRNALYAHSGYFRNSYDQAMRDENLRLAYVAITRGVSRVIWYCRRPQGATAVLAARAPDL